MLQTIQTIVCDMDGTLAKSRQEADPQMIDAITELARTYHFVIITGGKLDLVKMQITNLLDQKRDDFVIHIFPTSGNQYYVYQAGEYHEQYKHNLEMDDVNKILNSIISCVNHFKLAPRTPDQIEYRESQVTFSVLGRTASYEEKKNYDPSGVWRQKFIAHIKSYLGADAEKYSIRLGGMTSIDFTYKGHDKGFGLEMIKKYLENKNEDILFFGDKCFDGGNDWEIAKEVQHIQVNDEVECLWYFGQLLEYGEGGIDQFINSAHVDKS